MLCPKCGGQSTVIDSRMISGTVRRRRECEQCGHRFSTEETLYKFQRVDKPIILGDMITQFMNGKKEANR